MDNNAKDVKHIIIEESQKNKCHQGKTKKINCEKEKKMRVETKTWGLNEEELSHQTQLNICILDSFEALYAPSKLQICGQGGGGISVYFVLHMQGYLLAL